jgi:hypothetical protein
VFQALGYLRRDSDTNPSDIEKLLALRDWFDIYLEPPDQFTKRRTHRDSGTAVSWYRDSATEYISRMYAMAQIFENYGIVVDLVRRADPGYIVYEDEYQVTAIPYREDREKVV